MISTINNSGVLSYFSGDPESILNASNTLKCNTLWSRKHQTWSRHSLDQWPSTRPGCNPRRSLRFHRMNFITVGSVNGVPVPFVLWYFVCPRFDRRYPIYLVHPCYQQTCLLVPVILQPRDLVTWLRNLYDVIPPSGPRVPFRHYDGQIPLCSICKLINISISEYPKYTFMATIF